jgi:formylglycine-generating enzyme required for sulfatase activity
MTQSRHGVLDMSGNVWEWCLNEYAAPDHFQLDGSEYRVLRGGSFIVFPDYARCAFRYRSLPVDRNYLIGFRVVVRSARVSSP